MDACVGQNMSVACVITKSDQFDAQNLGAMWLAVRYIFAGCDGIPKIDVHKSLPACVVSRNVGANHANAPGVWAAWKILIRWSCATAGFFAGSFWKPVCHSFQHGLCEFMRPLNFSGLPACSSGGFEVGQFSAHIGRAIDYLSVGGQACRPRSLTQA
jgi:hypothetical protein